VTTPQSASETFDDARDDEDDDDDDGDDARANARDAHPSVAPRARVPVEREDDETARDGWRR